jgi:iron(III) transport system ATP-binding protein
MVARPATGFVGRFVLQGNLLPAQWQASRLATPLGWLEPLSTGPLPPVDPSQPLEVLVSPLGLELQADEGGAAWVLGREFLGREWLYQVQCGDLKLRLRLPLEADFQRGQRCRLRLRAGEPARLFPGGVELVAAAEVPQVL